jgi:hypothetical protein
MNIFKKLFGKKEIVLIPTKKEGITKAIQIKAIIKPIPAEKFISTLYGDRMGNSCFLGHIHRKLSGEADYWGDGDGYGARQLTEKFLNKVHGVNASGADVNNYPDINGYTEPEIKDRVIHMINDMIKAGF